MKIEFEMTDLGIIKYFLSIEVEEFKDGIFICQSKYAKDIFRKFRMVNCCSIRTPIYIGTKLSKYD